MKRNIVMEKQDKTAADAKSAMRRFLAQNALIRGDSITLSGGAAANFYFDCKRATMDGGFLSLLGDYIIEEICPQLQPKPDIVGGPTLGADFIAAAVVLKAATTAKPGGAPLIASIVRKEAKKHGTKNKIENEPPRPSRVLVVEDVITTGASIARACNEFVAAGHSIAAIFALIDRDAGGRQMLEEKYRAPVFALFGMADFPEIQ